MASKTRTRKVLIAAAIVVAGLVCASPAQAVDGPPDRGQVGTAGYTWSN